MTIYEVLKQEIEALGSIRLPISESEAIQRIGMVARDLGECVKAIEQAEMAEKANAESESKPEIKVEPIVAEEI